MRKLLLGTVLSLALPGLALAVPVSGQLSVNGNDTFSATTLTPVGVGNVGAGTATGTYLTPFAPGCTGCETTSPLTYNVLGAISPVMLYSATIGATTATFTVNTINSFSNSGGFLDISASGFATETGFTNSPGTVLISTQGNGTVTYSLTSTATPAPEPASLALLGVGMVGLATARRRSRGTPAHTSTTA